MGCGLVSREKTVYDIPAGGGRQLGEVGGGGQVLLSDQAPKKVEEFKNLRSVFQSNGNVEADVVNRIRRS